MRKQNASSKIFGQRLRQARQRWQLAQDELGVLAGLEESSSSARMSRYESGIHAPPFQFVETIAKLLKVSPSYFYCPDDRLADLILIYSAISEDQRQELYKLAVILADRTLP
jgi:transcriptional regulator with XRE-family HTH domain